MSVTVNADVGGQAQTLTATTTFDVYRPAQDPLGFRYFGEQNEAHVNPAGKPVPPGGVVLGCTMTIGAPADPETGKYYWVQLIKRGCGKPPLPRV